MIHLLLVVIYLSFISLGLPDSLLGAAWPSMYTVLGVSLSAAGIISILITICTVLSSLLSDRIVRRFGAGLVTAVSVGMTAAAMFGFSAATQFWMLCLWALPYGLGAGSIDAALNNFVALHYHARHMSWLHCFWGVGAALGPYIMGACLTGQTGWQGGYRIVSLLQCGLTILLFVSLSLWKQKATAENQPAQNTRPYRISQLIHLPGAKAALAAFFFYCSLELSTGLWGATYLVLEKGIQADRAASLVSLFFLGITAGRLICGFLASRLRGVQLIRIGECLAAAAILLLFLGTNAVVCGAALTVLGIGCAPVFPCLIHDTPQRVGADASQAMIGLQMALAYTGNTIAPPVMGLFVERVTPLAFTLLLLLFLCCLVAMTESLRRLDGRRSKTDAK